MIPVQLAPEPKEFDETVRTPGLRSIYEKTGQAIPPQLARTAGRPFARVKVKLQAADGSFLKTAKGRIRTRYAKIPADLAGEDVHAYWSEALDWLLTSYDRICSFCCFRIHATASPSVDHMAPKSLAWDKVYEWSNYRLAALRLNAKKGAMTHVLDPFDVQPEWFAIELTFGQVVPGPATENDLALQARVDATITDLGLNDFADDRLRDIEAYEQGDVSFRRLREESPFVAIELLRQGRVRPEDRR